MFPKLAVTFLSRTGAIVAALWFFAAPVAAQRNRLPGTIRNTQRVRLAGHIPAQARAENDEGPADPSLRLRSMTLILKPSDAQQAELDRLLEEQQDPKSPNYHRWLTPEEFAGRFGVSMDDIQRVTAWLGQQNLTVSGVGRARNWIHFSGTAENVENAFGVQIHRFRVDGEEHFSNTNDPLIPADLDLVVRGIRGLNDFRLAPRRTIRKPMTTANFTSSSGNHYLAPDDIATIYNIKPLLDSGLDGSGQKIVVVGQTQIDLADIQQFRTRFALPANDPQIVLVPGLRDPGVSSDDLGEADLDLEWAGAVARNATLVYVYSDNVLDAVEYAIDQNLAPVLSMSYGLCEAQTSLSQALAFRSWARQANAQGMTWIAASGDSGGADCASGTRSPGGLAVDVPASIPEVTGLGGTEFAEGSASYWTASNSASGASVVSYIPETVWNDSELAGSPAAGGGGVSTFFAKPSWQNAPGVPNDGARDVPDVSLASSAAHDGYLIYSAGKLSAVGGTSVAAPVFAGMAALINQRLVATGAQSVPGLGNMNPNLYSLARSNPSVFHDVITGHNKVTVTCSARSRNCVPGTYGWDAGAGYDLASGLGSVDAYLLVTNWNPGVQPSVTGPPAISGITNGASFRPSFAPGMVATVFGSNLAAGTWSANAVPLATQAAGFSATVNGTPAPLYYVSPGQVNLQIPYNVSGSAVVTISTSGGSASSTIPLAAAAPGIFADAAGGAVPFGSASRGQVVTLYVTGAGAVSPSIATGAAPSAQTPVANLPAPAQAVTVSVGGVNAPLQFAGIASGLVGVVQINYQVPSGAPLGAQPVTVSIGGVASPSATLTVLP